MFQVFCSHLKQLIQLLYTVSEKMELLAAPTADIHSVKSTLAEYQVRTVLNILLYSRVMQAADLAMVLFLLHRLGRCEHVYDAGASFLL